MFNTTNLKANTQLVLSVYAKAFKQTAVLFEATSTLLSNPVAQDIVSDTVVEVVDVVLKAKTELCNNASVVDQITALVDAFNDIQNP